MSKASVWSWMWWRLAWSPCDPLKIQAPTYRFLGFGLWWRRGRCLSVGYGVLRCEQPAGHEKAHKSDSATWA